MLCFAGISCYSSIDCGEIEGGAPVMVTTLEECCLQSPFQPRSFEVPLMSAVAKLGLECGQCIGKEFYLSSPYSQLLTIYTKCT